MNLFLMNLFLVAFFCFIFAIVMAVRCKQSVILARALILGFILPGLMGFLLALAVQLTKFPSIDFKEMVNTTFSFFFTVAILGFIPASLTITVCDSLWVLKNIHHKGLPILIGAGFSLLYSFLLGMGLLGLFFAIIGAIGGLIFLVFRQRVMVLE